MLLVILLYIFFVLFLGVFATLLVAGLYISLNGEGKERKIGLFCLVLSVVFIYLIWLQNEVMVYRIVRGEGRDLVEGVIFTPNFIEINDVYLVRWEAGTPEGKLVSVFEPKGEGVLMRKYFLLPDTYGKNPHFVFYAGGVRGATEAEICSPEP